MIVMMMMPRIRHVRPIFSFCKHTSKFEASSAEESLSCSNTLSVAVTFACISQHSQLCNESFPKNQQANFWVFSHLSCGEAEVHCALGDVQKVEIRVSLMADFDSDLQAGATRERFSLYSIPSTALVEAPRASGTRWPIRQSALRDGPTSRVLSNAHTDL